MVELHTLVRAGGGAGGTDAANILKPAPARDFTRHLGHHHPGIPPTYHIGKDPANCAKLLPMDLNHLAQLANLPLSPSDADLLGGQMDQILSYISKLRQFKLDHQSESPSLKNVSRPDQTGACLPPQPAFTVPGILAAD